VAQAAREAALKSAAEDPDISFEEWMRLTTTSAVDTEINVQLGEFTLKKHQMELLGNEIVTHPDYMAGERSANAPSSRGLSLLPPQL
jgi:hypothetical protein